MNADVLRRPLATAGIVALAVLVLVFGTSATHGADPDSYDVVVVGAGPGGIGAAIQAATMGSKVALLSESDWIGGQITTAGVSTMDEGGIEPRQYGVYAEFVRRVTAAYASRNKSMHTCYGSARAICVEPSLAQRVLRQMVDTHASITLVTKAKVTAVTKSKETVTGVQTDTGRLLKSRVVIDASEYGDVLPLADATYRIGNGTSTEPPASTACVQDFTYTAVIRRYPNGTPSKLILKKAPPGYSAKLAAGFASAVRANGLDLLPGYPSPWNWTAFISYRGMPDSARKKAYDPASDGGKGITRSSINHQVVDQPGSVKFIEDPVFRAKTICEAKLMTLRFLYYLQHDLGHTDWSIANDEGYDKLGNVKDRHCPLLAGYEAIEKHFPLEPYVRESRRLVGVETLTGRDVARAGGTPARQYADSVAVGYFPVNLRRCRAPENLETGLDSAEDVTGSAGPFEVPIGTLIPTNVDGLLAAEKNISASRIAASAVRLQPIAFAIGQAAGALASLAADQHAAPRAVDPDDVRQALKKSDVQIDSVR